MKISRVLVTGADGYIGAHVVRNLVSRGIPTVACSTHFNFVDLGAERLCEDIFNSDKDIYSLAGNPDCVIHLAWHNGFNHNAESHLEELPMHVKFLNQMIQHGVSSISVMGSMHEIGYWEGAITETTPTNPESLYGIAKNALRQALMVMTKNSQIAVHWLRGYYIYGDDERSSSVFGKILMASKEGKKHFPFTSGEKLFDFISVDELAKQIVSASLQSEITGIINCCSGKPVSLKSMAERFIYENHLDITLDYGAFPDRSYDSPGEWGDPSKIQAIMEKEEQK